MSLDLHRLENVRDLDEVIQARCPACAEEGGDSSGNHLRFYPNGAFGCCVHQGDRSHRKRIFALAGIRTKGRNLSKSDKWKFAIRVARSVEASHSRPKVLVIEKNVTVRTTPDGTPKKVKILRTLRTHIFQSRAYGREKNNNVPCTYKDLEIPVLSVLKNVQNSKPYIMHDGTLVIPFASDAKYHWWRGGQSVEQTRQELGRGI